MISSSALPCFVPGTGIVFFQTSTLPIVGVSVCTPPHAWYDRAVLPSQVTKVLLECIKCLDVSLDVFESVPDIHTDRCEQVLLTDRIDNTGDRALETPVQAPQHPPSEDPSPRADPEHAMDQKIQT